LPWVIAANTGGSPEQYWDIASRKSGPKGFIFDDGHGDGPSLAEFGVTGILEQPSLSVFNSSGTVVASNTGWETNANPALIASTAVAVGAFALPSGSADSAEVVNLSAGAFTRHVSGVDNTTGVGLAEVYEEQ
jgi:hypothetical protein